MGPEYYAKLPAILALLLEKGITANRANWQGFTLLHHMAVKGDLAKARLLLDRSHQPLDLREAQ